MHHPKLLTILTFTSLTSALALPNILPKYQQEIIHQPNTQPSDNDNLHFQSTIRDVLLANQIIPQVLDDFEPTYYIDISYPSSKHHKHHDNHHDRVLLGNTLAVKHVSRRPIFTFHAITGPPSYGDPPNEKNITFTLILTDPDALSRKHPVKSEMCHWIVTNLTTPIGQDNLFEWPNTIDIDSDLFTEEEIDDILEDLELDLSTELEIENILEEDDHHDENNNEEDDEDMSPFKKHKKDKKDKKHKKHKKGKHSKDDKKLANEIESYYPPAPPKKTGPHRYVFVLLAHEGHPKTLIPPKERPHWGYGKERHGVRDWAAENNLTVVGTNFFFAEHKKKR